MKKLAENEEIDGIICYELSRIGRSARNLLNFLHTLNNAEKHLITLSGNKIDTTSPGGKFLLTTLCGFIEYEADSIKRRLKNGRYRAIANGIPMGRNFIPLDEKKMIKLYKQGWGCHRIAKEMECASSTIYRRLKKLEDKGKVKLRKIYAITELTEGIKQ